jgi:hypothetical protein
MRGLCSRTSVDDEDDVADLKVVKILEQRIRHRTSDTSAYSHTYSDHDDSWNPVSSRDVEVDDFGEGSGNSTTRQRIMVMIPISYAALWEATRERERERGRQRAAARDRPAHQEVVGGGRGGGLVGCVVHLSSWDPPLYRGEGCTLTPPPRHQEAVAKEEEKGGSGQGWGRPPPRNPNPGRPRPGLWRPHFSFIP